MSTSMDLALTVALPNPDSWGTVCPAWIESADRKCGKPRPKGYLCKRHHGVAVKRLAAQQEKDARAAERAAERRAASLPKWRAELARIEKRMRVLDPPPPTDDMAAYGGVEVKAITRYQRRTLSDSRIEEMARLVTRAEHLRRWIGED